MIYYNFDNIGEWGESVVDNKVKWRMNSVLIKKDIN